MSPAPKGESLAASTSARYNGSVRAVVSRTMSLASMTPFVSGPRAGDGGGHPKTSQAGNRRPRRLRRR